MNLDFTLDNYQQVLSRQGVRDRRRRMARPRRCRATTGRRLPQQPHRDHPGHGHPDPDRRLCRLWLRLDEVSRAGGSSSSWSWRCWWCRCRSRWCPSCATTCRLRHQRHLPGHLAGAHRLRPAAGHLPALQLHQRAAARDPRVGLHRRRLALHDLHAADPAAVGAGPGLLRHLPVPVGLERLPGGADLPGRQRRTCRC